MIRFLITTDERAGGRRRWRAAWLALGALALGTWLGVSPVDARPSTSVVGTVGQSAASPATVQSFNKVSLEAPGIEAP